MRSNVWRLSRLWCAAVFVCMAAGARADVVYNDTVSPDLSNNYLNPTSITLPYGTSSIILRTRLDEQSMVDVDLFTIHLPAGGALSHLVLASDVGTSGTSFIALEEGATLTFNPLGNDGADAYICLDDCLGYSHFGPNESFNGMGIGDDLLVGADGSSGLDDSHSPGFFHPPLFGSQYAFWVQEFNGDVTVQLNFVVPPVFGDYNHDGSTNAADYTVWRNALGTNVVAGTSADGNGDGHITLADYAIWKGNYGFAPGSGTAVPEPSTCLLLLIGLVASPRLAARRRFGSSILG